MFFQTPAPPALLDKIVAHVAELHRTLPSLITQEDILSDLSQHGIYRAHAKAVATLRVYPGAPGEQLNESREFVSYDGKAVTPDKKVVLPFELHGAFSRIPETFFTPAKLPCYVFTQLPQANPDGSVQLTFVTAPAPAPACTAKVVSLSGIARVDPATGHILHLERTILTPPDKGQHSTTFASVDYAPVKLGDQTFWLPTELTAALENGLGHFKATFSNFHRYTGSAKILTPDQTDQ